MSCAHVLSWSQSAAALQALTRPDRVDYLTALVTRYPDGALIRSPQGRFLATAASGAAKRVLVENSANYRKGLGQSHARAIIGDGLLTAEGERWRAQRDAATPFLRARSVQAHIPAFYEHALRSVEALSRDLHEWETVDLTVPLAAYTLSCLGEVFGLATPDAARIHDAFDTIQDEAIFRSITRDRIPLAVRPKAGRRLTRALDTLREETARALGGRARTEEWAGFDGMCSLFLAGYETTSSTLAWSVHNLAGRPSLQADLACEGRDLGMADRPGLEETNGLGWSRAVLKETLRLRPPVWLLSREALGPDEVSGIAIRPGDEVLILPSAVHQHGWDDPHQFRPERFDVPGGATMWFGAGPRACPGGTLALLEGSIWLAVAMAHLELRLLPGVPVTAVARMSQTPSTAAAIQARVRRPAARVRPTPTPTPAVA